jgi:alpha-L-rhamnosidase
MMLWWLCLSIACCASAAPAEDLRVQHQKNPTIDAPSPVFTWTVPLSGQRGVAQAAFELQVASTATFSSADFATGVVNSNRSAFTLPPSVNFTADTAYFWRVRWTRNSATAVPSEWSVSNFRAGLLDPSDWHGAQWLSCGANDSACLQFRHEFSLSPNSSATVYIACVGWFEARLNGVKLGGDAVLEPGWTQWNKRLEYVAYEVPPSALRAGPNALGLWLGGGWPGHLGLRPALRVLVSVQGGVGAAARRTYIASAAPAAGIAGLSSSGGFRTARGPVTANDIYLGESYDARLETTGWDRPGFDDSGWADAAAGMPAENGLTAGAALTARKNEPIERRPALLVGRSVSFVREPGRTPLPEGAYIVDVGQNIAGWAHVTLPEGCPIGTNVTLRHAEYLSADGTIYVGNLRHAKATDVYVCRGAAAAAGAADAEEYEPRFTYHGFRFIEVLTARHCSLTAHSRLASAFFCFFVFFLLHPGLQLAGSRRAHAGTGASHSPLPALSRCRRRRARRTASHSPLPALSRCRRAWCTAPSRRTGASRPATAPPARRASPSSTSCRRTCGGRSWTTCTPCPPTATR